MKLYEVVFQDDLECTGQNLITEIVVAENEEEAIEKAWNNFKNSCGESIICNRKDHSVSYIGEISELDGYEIIVREKRHYVKGSNYFN